MSEPHRLHPAAIALWTLRFAREWFIPAVIPIAVQFGRHGMDFLNTQTMLLIAAGVLVFLGIATAFGILTWRRFTYRVEAGELRIEQGVISRKQRYIPIERIQAVDVSQGLLQRVFSVVSVRVETAGGGGTRPEVSLASVSREHAGELRQALAGHTQTVDAQQETSAAEPTRRLSVADLVLAGSTSGRVGVALSIVASTLALADRVFTFDTVAGQFERLAGVGAALLAGVVFVAFIWLLGLIGTILAHAGFTLTRDGDSLTIDRGLLEKRHATIPVDRIQTIRMVEGLLRQPFGLVELRIESAGYGDNAGESTVLFPLLRRSEVLPLLREMTPALAVLPELQRLPARSRGRYAFRLSQLLPAIALATLLSVLLFPSGLAALLLIPAAILLGVRQFHDAGWVVAGDTLLIRTRVLTRTTVIMPRRRIQQGETRRSPFQRRAELATFASRVASGSGGAEFDLQHMDEADAQELLAWLAPAGRKASSGGIHHAAPPID